MRMKDNQYQWFRAAAEGIRRLDGSVSRIAGIFINIDAKKKEVMQTQKSAAFLGLLRKQICASIM